MRHSQCIFWLAIVLGASATSAVASGSGSSTNESSSLTFENDLFFGTDRYYTNGIQYDRLKRLTNKSSDAEQTPLTKRICEVAGCSGAPISSVRDAAGQLMYTPENISISTPQPDDRPWAGMLYYLREYTFVEKATGDLTKLTAQFGVVGPAALARQTQTLVHDTFSGDKPMGWGNQIRNELGLLLMLQKKHALEGFNKTLGSGVDLRTVGTWRLAVGNIATFAGAGLEFTVGKNLDKVPDFSGIIDIKRHDPGPTLMSHPVDFDMSRATSSSSTCYFDWLQCTLMASVEARAIAYSIVLDGTMFRNGPSVKRRPLVLDASVGARLTFPKTASVSAGPWFVQFRATRRSPEFRSTKTVRSQSFGALTVGRDFY